MRRVRPDRRIEEILLLHDNARPYVSLRTTEAITKLMWTVLHAHHRVQSWHLQIINCSEIRERRLLVTSVKKVAYKHWS
jgi:hypothetical protein